MLTSPALDLPLLPNPLPLRPLLHLHPRHNPPPSSSSTQSATSAPTHVALSTQIRYFLLPPIAFQLGLIYSDIVVPKPRSRDPAQPLHARLYRFMRSLLCGLDCDFGVGGCGLLGLCDYYGGSGWEGWVEGEG